MLGTGRRADRLGGLHHGPLLGDVHRDGCGADGSLALGRDHRERGERPPLVVEGHVVFDGLVGSALPRKERVQRLDRLLRTHERGRAEELCKELATEHPVVLKPLIAGGEVV